ncbi:MAG TPA: translation initiation factor IF-3 [Oligoflexia bacterium]|nr:translation initiation factor IF-3 [Oligoflexia bacterium]HMP47140.1 translation initiation factor IF-3 [Oligoflexia bacterium]
MQRRGNFRRLPSEVEEKHRINDQITSHEVRLILDDGEQKGVISTREAIRIAEDAGLDLVEVAPDANPPVCRLIDYGKLKYREQKKAAEARKKNFVQVVKEIRIRYSTDSHDLETKIKHARRFLEEGDKVRFSMRFRGREVVYKELGDEIFNQLALALADYAVMEERAPLANQKMHVTFGPKGISGGSSASK